MVDQQSLFWIGFIVLIFILLALDLGVFNRRSHVIKMKEAILLSLFWISISVMFNIWIYFQFGEQKAFEFLTGYVIEKALSIDNLFVFLMYCGVLYLHLSVCLGLPASRRWGVNYRANIHSPSAFASSEQFNRFLHHALTHFKDLWQKRFPYYINGGDMLPGNNEMCR